jgi:hypothetical protein
MPLLHTVTLPNGLIMEFHDQSNRYFGDYWRVSIEARCRIPVEDAFPDKMDPELERARVLLGETLVYERALDKMGVPGDEVPSICRKMIESFLESNASYLSDPSFAARYVRKRLSERKSGLRPFLVPK